jgi:hypothetical protein
MRVNGNVSLPTGGQGEFQNALIERVSDVPSVNPAEKGRIVFNTTSNTYFYNNGTVWMAFATGGNATALQNEVDALEVALGSSINASGQFVTGQFTGYASGATTITEAINMVQQAVTAHNTLGELDNVADTADSAPVTGNFIKYTGSQWANVTPVLADISNVTATASEVNELHTSGIVTADLVKLHAVTSTAAELNILTGATLTTTELNYVDGVTSSIQSQLNNKQPLDDQLTSLAGLTPDATSAFLLGGAGGVYSLQDAAGFRAALGVSLGSNVQAFDADLTTLAGFAPAADSSETLTINTTEITHSGLNDIIVGTGGAEGSRWTLERGAVARTSLGLGNIAIMDEHDFIRANAASSNISNNVAFNGYKITNLAPGTAGTDAINLNQMQSFIAGLSWKPAVVAASVGNLTLSGEQTVDGVAVVTGNRVLVKNQTTASENGIYVVASSAWARATDFDALADSINSAAVFVQQGATQNDTGWTQTAEVVTFGTDPVVWTQFNGAAGITAGIGLAKDGNTLNVNLGAGIVELPSDDVGIDLYDPTSSAIILTENATTRSTDTNAKLHLLLDLTGNGKLVQSVAGLKVTTNTITEAELTASVAGNGLTGGNGSAIAVVSHAGTGTSGAQDDPANWGGVGLVTVTADSVGVTLGNGSTQAAPGTHTHKAAAITYSGATSTLVATTVQGAIDEVEGRVDTIETNAGNLLTEVNAIESAVGLNTDGSLNSWSGTNYVNSATTFKAAVSALDTATKALDTQINNKVNKMYYLYTGGAATGHTVTHSLGQMYCNVTVIDAANNEVIIPQSIVFTDANSLAVTLNVSLAVKVVVMGLA